MSGSRGSLCTYILTYVHTYIHTYIHKYVRTYIHTYIHSYIHKYVRTYIHTHTHTHTHKSSVLSRLSAWARARAQTQISGYASRISYYRHIFGANAGVISGV